MFGFLSVTRKVADVLERSFNQAERPGSKLGFCLVAIHKNGSDQAHLSKVETNGAECLGQRKNGDFSGSTQLPKIQVDILQIKLACCATEEKNTKRSEPELFFGASLGISYMKKSCSDYCHQIRRKVKQLTIILQTSSSHKVPGHCAALKTENLNWNENRSLQHQRTSRWEMGLRTGNDFGK